MTSRAQPQAIVHGDWLFKPWITHDSIEARTAELASCIGREYRGERIRLITVLKGAQPFAQLLLAKLKEIPDGPAEIITDSLRVKSYMGTTSGELHWIKDLGMPTRSDVHDIVVEDIVDSGRTLSHIEAALKNRYPASLISVALLDRPEARASGIIYTPALVGFRIADPEVWAIGFGLDLDEAYRDEPHIYGKVVNGISPPVYTIPKLSFKPRHVP